MNRKWGVLSAAALVGAGAIGSTGVQAGDRGAALAAGLIGGVAAGAILGAAASNAYAAPAYGYNYPAYGPEYGYHAPVATYRTTRVVRYAPTYPARRVVHRDVYGDGYVAPAPRYRTTRVVRYAPAPMYDDWGYAAPARRTTVVRSYGGYAPASYGFSWGGPAYYGW